MSREQFRPSADYTRVDQETGEVLHDPAGREIPDSTPMQPPVGYNRQPSLAEQIRAMVVSEKLRAEAAAAGLESFEEADDFEVGDDFEHLPASAYEANFDPMTDQERAALSSQGRDVDRIVPAPKRAKKQRPAEPPAGSSDQDEPPLFPDAGGRESGEA